MRTVQVIAALAAVVVSCSAQHYSGGLGGLGGYGGGYEGGHGEKAIDYYAEPHYKFEYSVHDAHTGDIKSQHETREKDVVKGHYSLHEADGTVREVHYSSDDHNGFNAEVKRTGHAVHAHQKSHYAPSIPVHY